MRQYVKTFEDISNAGRMTEVNIHQDKLKQDRRLRNCLKTIDPKLEDILNLDIVNKTEIACLMYPEQASIKPQRATAVLFHKITGDRKFTTKELIDLKTILNKYVDNNLKAFNDLKNKLNTL